jgi:hypothetical protein
MKKLLICAAVLAANLCSADQLGIIRNDSDTDAVVALAADHPEQLMTCPYLDHQRMRFYGITDQVTLLSYLWGYWNEKRSETEVYDLHTKRVEEAMNLGWGFARLYLADTNVSIGLSEELGRVLSIIEDQENIRWCRPRLRNQLFEFDRRMRAFRASVGD